MINKECRVARQEIDELELTERPSEGVAAHLQACAACREFQSQRAELRALVGSLEPVAAPADFDMRLRAKIAAERSGQTQPFTFARLLSTPALAAAALFVAVAGSLVWVAQRDPGTSAPQVTQSAPANPEKVDKASPPETGTSVVSVNDQTPKAGSDELATEGGRKRTALRPRSRDFSVLPARTISQGDQAFVNVPSKPVVVGLEDERGTTRKTVPAVSFGAQSLVDNRVPASYSGRVW